jgi:hypothetical protein
MVKLQETTFLNITPKIHLVCIHTNTNSKIKSELEMNIFCTEYIMQKLLDEDILFLKRSLSISSHLKCYR